MFVINPWNQNQSVRFEIYTFFVMLPFYSVNLLYDTMFTSFIVSLSLFKVFTIDHLMKL